MGASIRAYANPVTDPAARIRAGGETWLYPLDTPVTFAPLDSPGTCVIQIADGSVGVVYSQCPQQICMSMGRVKSAGQWIACLPHQVFIDIVGGESDTNVDGATY